MPDPMMFGMVDVVLPTPRAEATKVASYFVIVLACFASALGCVASINFDLNQILRSPDSQFQLLLSPAIFSMLALITSP
jgi:hypothetical protein